PRAKNVYKVPVSGSPLKGPAAAKVTIVEYGDYACSYCKQVQADVDRLLQEYGDEVRLFFKDAPQSDEAYLAVSARRTAEEEGKSWEMHDAIMRSPDLTRGQLESFARKLNLDSARFKLRLDSKEFTGETERRIRTAVEEAQRFSAESTPTFFVNGR